MRISFVLYRKDAIVSSDSLSPHRDLGFGTWDKVPADFSQNIGGGWWYDNSSAECAVRSNLISKHFVHLSPRSGSFSKPLIRLNQLSVS